jgi:hypothetical protein
LKKVSYDRANVYVIWDPIFGGDFDGEAKKLSKGFPDKRVSYFKDPDSLAGKLWKHVLKLDNDIAWDVYLLYGADAQWDKEPPQPAFWMHQLYGVTKAPRFDEPIFEAKLKEMLKTTEEKSGTSGKAQSNGKKLKVEFPYFKDCPPHKQALENLKTALLETQAKAELVLINVKTDHTRARPVLPAPIRRGAFVKGFNLPEDLAVIYYVEEDFSALLECLYEFYSPC